jgi:POT family proton-dependent oligopeptide transporter
MDFAGRMVNVGSLGSVATTLMEKYIGLDLCAVAICVLVVQVARPKFGAFGGLCRKR